MSLHVVTLHPGEQPGGIKIYSTRCTCRKFSSDVTESRLEAEMAGERHLRLVEQARVHRSSRSPRLENEADYYRKMADDPDQPAADRVLWAGLADELDARLGRNLHASQDALW